MPQTCGMLPLPSNALKRFSAKGFGLITGHFPWIKSGGDLHVDSRNDSLSNLHFCDMVSAEPFRVKGRKRLTVVSEEFNESMKFFWVRVFEGIALWHDLGALTGHGATPDDTLKIFIGCRPKEERKQVYQALDALHSNAVEDAQDLLQLVDSCNNWGVSNILLSELHSSHFMGSIIPLSFKVSLVEQMIHVRNINSGGYYPGGRKRRNVEENSQRWKMSEGINGDFN
jgi:hypothetical protein